MDRTALKEREKIIELMSGEADNQPMASQRVIEARDVLDDALEEYIVAVQEDAFYWGYMTAIAAYAVDDLARFTVEEVADIGIRKKV